MKEQGSIEVIVVLGVVLAVMGMLTAMELEIRSHTRAAQLVRDRSIRTDLLNYLQTNADCAQTRLSGCTDPIAVLSPAGTPLLSTSGMQLGPLFAQAKCDAGSSSIHLDIFKNGNPQKVNLLVCD